MTGLHAFGHADFLDAAREAMARYRDRRLGERAVELGVLTLDRLEECLRALDAGEASSLEALLAARGWATPAQIARLAGPPEPADPPEVASARADPSRRLGPFVLVQEVGRGGMARVWKAWDGRLGRWVAVKLMKDDGDEALRERFLREVRAAAGLNHPNLVTVHEAGEVDGRLFLVMEYVEGRPLEPGEALETVVERLRKVALAVESAHRQGIVHRDLKPANVLVDASGEPRVVDFGLAHLMDPRLQLTQDGARLGTPLYMAPEQAAGKVDAIGPATDVYALGVILYEALAGRKPHESGSDAHLFHRVQHEDASPPEGPRDLVAVCMKAISRDPARRYPSAGAFAEELARHQRGEPVEARPPGWLARWSRRMRRRVGIALLAAGVLAAGSWGWRESRAYGRLKRQEELRGELGPFEELIKGARKDCYNAALDFERRVRELEEALGRLEALARRPGYAELPDAWGLLGMGWYFAGDPRRAEMAVDRAVELGTQDAAVLACRERIWLDRGLTLHLTGWFDSRPKQLAEARYWADRALAQPARQGDDLAETVIRAYWAAAGDDLEGVLRMCGEGLSRFKGREGVEEFLVLRSLVGTVPEKRIQDLNLALRIRPHYPWAQFLRGTLQTDVERKVADFDQAIRVNPRFALAYVQRGRVRLDSGKDPQAALSDFEEAIRRDPHLAPAHLWRGVARRKLGQDPVEDFTRAAQAKPEWAQPLHHRGVAHGQAGRWEAAAADFAAALKINPVYHQAMRDLAVTRLRRPGLAWPWNPDALDLGAVETADLKAALKDFETALETPAGWAARAAETGASKGELEILDRTLVRIREELRRR